MLRLVLSCISLAVVGIALWPLEAEAGSAPDFEKQILPILKAHCYECHDARKQKSGFRLDIRGKALAGGESNVPAIVPGKADQSELYRRISSDEPNEVMPPTKGKRLTPEQIRLIKEWINAGAPWPDALAGDKARAHWAFRAPTKPALPVIKSSAWCRNEIDRFILARLEKEQLAPSVEADKVTLLRRLHLDLTGLPPTIGEMDAFLADSSPGAYDKIVEKLLASPHHGERWGRHWLDAARYADSDGYEKDKSRQMWFYRDWVVSAFNRDLPYDRFIIEQLAGDLLPNATQDQIVATGYLRNSMLNEEGGVDPEQFRMDAMFDRLDAIGKGILGLTIQCAQCHSHKFDPITQEEYYRLFAYLNNDHEAQRVVYTPDEQMKIAELRRQMLAIENDLQHKTPDWPERLAVWEEGIRKQRVAWTTLTRLENAGDNAQRYTPQKDGSILAQGYAPTKFDTHLRGPSELKTIRAFRLELLNDPNLPCSGPGRSFMGTCALTEFKVQARDDHGKKQSVKFVKAAADYGNPVRDLEPNFDDRSNKKRVTGPIEFAIDGKADTAWGIDQGPGRRNQPRVAVFIPEKPLEMPPGSELEVFLVQQHGGWNSDDHMNNNLGRFRLSVTDKDGADKDVLPPRVQAILDLSVNKRTPVQQAALFAYWRRTVPEWKDANEQIERLWLQWPPGSTSLTVLARETPRETHLLKRGDFLKPAQPVTAGTPAFLPPLADPSAPPNRLTFARWLVDRGAPTTARVFVNRVWQSYFGTGLVNTPEDFGTQGDAPSHPELLDWLAVEFMDHRWSVKHLHRLIVSSATYRQSSKMIPALLAKDPANRLLGRFPRLRVEGEVVRDVALAASGLLNPKVGGPSVFSPAPAFLFQPPASYGPFTWPEAQGPERYRRALYTFRRRSTPYPMLTNFDTPNGDAACVRRVRSNTPLQALTTLNETVFVECSRALGLRMILEGGKTDAERLGFGFRLCTSRGPSRAELAALEVLLDKQRQRFAEGWLSPAQVLFGSGEMKEKIPPQTTPTQWASFCLVGRVLLNLDETITRP